MKKGGYFIHLIEREVPTLKLNTTNLPFSPLDVYSYTYKFINSN